MTGSNHQTRRAESPVGARPMRQSRCSASSSRGNAELALVVPTMGAMTSTVSKISSSPAPAAWAASMAAAKDWVSESSATRPEPYQRLGLGVEKCPRTRDPA